MVAGYYRATFKIPTDSGIPQDTINNVWSFRQLTVVDRDADAIEIRTRLGNFYDTLAPKLSSALDLAHCRIVIVDLMDSKPRLPFYDEEYSPTGAATSSDDMAPQVAMCLSFRGTRASGLNMRRRRGRLYLGPLQGTTDHNLAFTSFATDIVDNAITNVAVDDGSLTWCVYSPYTHRDIPVGEKLEGDNYPEDPALLPSSFVPVVHVWCDNAWDIQRRRGITATTRVSEDVA